MTDKRTHPSTRKDRVGTSRLDTEHLSNSDDDRPFYKSESPVWFPMRPRDESKPDCARSNQESH